MNYRQDKYGNNISILGFGCMRFLRKNGKIDINKAEELIMTAIEKGVNYFDTAYIYPGSEAALGEILEKNKARTRIYIASKMPHYLVKNKSDLDKIFYEELKRLKTDKIDYYFMHMLTDIESWKRMCALGVLEWIDDKKKKGEIGQIGFSYHGNTQMFKTLVDAYDWEFCMIQYNYMDENSQAGKAGLCYANRKGLPVMIMEPLRGGKLVNNIPADAKKIFSQYEISRTPAQWALRWLWNQKEVTCVLSGMNSLEMLEDNIQTASDVKINSFTEKDFAMLEKVSNTINSKMKVGCTGCGYCMPCPKNVDIPGTFSAYNRLYSEGRFAALREYFMCTAVRKNASSASNCIGCRKCEKHCPQGIEVASELKKAQKELEPLIYKVAKKAAQIFIKL